MKIIRFLILLILSQTLSFGQKEVDFNLIISNFKTRNYDKEVINPPFIHQDKNYKIVISEKGLPLEIKETVLRNPFDSTFPVSFSVIYENKLVSLFDNGHFVCHNIPKLDRNAEFEKQLNTQNFQYHWIINNKLVAKAGDKYYSFSSEHGWTRNAELVPMNNQPKLFEDDSYISFCDCEGEFGGTVYFFNKSTKKTYFTEATCANSILKKDNKYYVLSHLGHMMGSADMKVISNPDKLSFVDLTKTAKTFRGEALGYTDHSGEAKVFWNYYEVQIFSSFVYNDKTYYVVYWRDETFLAEIDNNTIRIVNPLFNKEIYTHDPITTNYGKTILMNLDFYGIGLEREVSCIIIQDGQLIKFDWNKKHSR